MSNTNPLQLLRSSTANKRPLAAGLVDGRPAINTNSASPGLFFKDSTGGLVKVGPVHVGTTAPNVSPASGGATGNSVGEQWLDTTGGTYVLKIWDGSAWRSESGTFVDVNGDVMTGALVMDNQQQVRFRETTANGTNYIALQAPASVASDKTITLPDVDGTVVTTGDTGTVTSTMILNGTIVDADVNASAAIAGTKISPDFGSRTVQTTGVFSAALGTAGAPTFTFTGDLNTGIYSPGADQVAISTGGTGRVFVDASGNVGVGTSSPDGLLTLAGANSNTPRFRIQHPSSDKDAAISTYFDGSGAYLLTGSNHYLNSAGSNAKFDATSGSAAWYLDGSGIGIFYNSSGSGAISERLRITSAGLVGVGTSSPDANSQLHIVGSSYQPLYVNTTGVGGGGATFFRSGTQALYVGTAGSSWLSGSSTADGLVRAEANLVLATNGNSRAVTIDTSQQVGIGTTSPSETLHVVGNGRIGNNTTNPDFTVVSSNTGNPGADTRVGTLKFAANANNVSDITAERNCGITATTGSDERFTNLDFYTSTVGGGAARVRIDSSGRVGIGTASPSDTLQINKTGAGGVKVVSTTQSTITFSNAAGTGGYIIGRSIGSDDAHNLFSYDATNSHYVDYFAGGSGGYRSFYTEGTERLRITSAGLVGIGTSSPTTTLDCRGVISTNDAIYCYNTARDGLGIWYNPGGAGVNQLTARVAGGDRLTIDSSGRVGIGTASPSGLLNLSASNAAGYVSQVLDNTNATGYVNQVFRIGSAGASGQAEINYAPGTFFAIGPVANDTTTPLVFRNNNATERVRITSAGLVGIGTSNPATVLNVQASAGEIVRATVSSNTGLYANIGADGNGGWFGSNADLSFKPSGTERARIDSSGRLLVGTSSSIGYGGLLQVVGGDTARPQIHRNVNDEYPAVLYISKARGTGVQSVLSGDEIGNISFIGYDGTQQLGAASITCFVDGTPGTNDMPGRIVLATTADGASSPTERMRITSAGLVGVGTSSPSSQLHCTGDIKFGDAITLSRSISTGLVTIADATAEPYTQGFAFRTNETDEAYRFQNGDGTSTYLTIRGSGAVGIGTTSPSAQLSMGNSVAAQKILVYENLSGGTNSRYGFGIQANEFRQFYPSDSVLTFGTINTSDGSTYSERARIDSSGRLLVGASSARTNFFNTAWGTRFQVEGTSDETSSIGAICNSNDIYGPSIQFAKSRGTTVGSNTVVQNGDTVGSIGFQGSDGSEFVAAASISAVVDGTPGANDMPGRLVFSTTADGASSPTERMRITNSGSILSFAASANDAITAGIESGAGATPYLFAGVHSRTGTAAGGTLSYSVAANGNVQNTNGSYTTISDAKLKENIVNAGSQWDDLKAIQIRNWNFKAETGHETHRQIGPIAQELETVCPGLVFATPDRDEDGNETGDVTKGVNQSVLYMKAVKALQEAMERIELLEARLDAANL